MNPIRVFVTHTFRESDDYLRVFEFLESVERFFYVNVSRPENIPAAGGMQAIKDELLAQIKQAEAVIVVSDALAEQGDLVRYSIDTAETNGIGTIAIRPYGGVMDMPDDITSRVNENIQWNSREIVDAIKRQGRGEDSARWESIDFPGFDADGETQ
jgi:hypothetical protein